LNLWSFVFMVPLGLNAAGAVRVGQAVGRRDREAVKRSGWTALALAALFTASAAAVFLVAGRPLIGAFSQDATVLALGPSLLAIAGVCLVFDGTQGVATGILRGLGETRIPMFANFAGHWLVGLPLGYVACFWWGWGVLGLWLGLAAGLTGVGTVLLLTWNRRVRKALPDAPDADSVR
jgi:MATE family multidrug resistance protein